MPLPPGLEATLPALALVDDVRSVSRSLGAVWAAAEHQPVAVTRCTRAQAAYAPGGRCVVTYSLGGESADGEPLETIGVMEIDSSRPAYRLYRDDARLAGVATAADSQAMGKRFAALIGEGDCAVTPVRYKPGVSCTFRYELRGPGQPRFFGKLFAERGDERQSVLAALAEAGAFPRTLKPLAYWPDLQLVVQTGVEGSELGATAFGASPSECADLLLEAGRSAAALTNVAVEGKSRALEDEARDLGGYGPLVAELAPPLRPGFDEAVAAVTGLARSRSEPAPVPSHGALRTDQFLVVDGGLVLIDLDGYCWANRARDVGNLLAYLDWRAIRLPETAPLVAAGRDAFLAGYSAVAPLPQPDWLEIYRAASMLKIAARRFRSLSFEEWDLVPELIETARATLASTG